MYDAEPVAALVLLTAPEDAEQDSTCATRLVANGAML